MRAASLAFQYVGGYVVAIALTLAMLFLSLNITKNVQTLRDQALTKTGGSSNALLTAGGTCQVWMTSAYYDAAALDPSGVDALAALSSTTSCSMQNPGGCEQICTCITRLRAACAIGTPTGQVTLCAASRCRLELS